jgi:hypothetical protein
LRAEVFYAYGADSPANLVAEHGANVKPKLYAVEDEIASCVRSLERLSQELCKLKP